MQRTTLRIDLSRYRLESMIIDAGLLSDTAATLTDALEVVLNQCYRGVEVTVIDAATQTGYEWDELHTSGALARTDEEIFADVDRVVALLLECWSALETPFGAQLTLSQGRQGWRMHKNA